MRAEDVDRKGPGPEGTLSGADRRLSAADTWASIWLALALKYGGDPTEVVAMHRRYFGVPDAVVAKENAVGRATHHVR